MTDDPQAMTAGPRTGVRPPADGVRTAEGRRLLDQLTEQDDYDGGPLRAIIAIEDAAFAQGVAAARAAVEEAGRWIASLGTDESAIVAADIEARLAALDSTDRPTEERTS